MLVEMINFCKPKIEYEVQHNKTNETILKQFMQKSNDLHEEEVWKWRSWDWYKLEKGTWSMDIEVEHFKVQQVPANLIKKPQKTNNFHQNKLASNWSMALMFHFWRPFGCEFSTMVAFVYFHLCEILAFNNRMMKSNSK